MDAGTRIAADAAQRKVFRRIFRLILTSRFASARTFPLSKCTVKFHSSSICIICIRGSNLIQSNLIQPNLNLIRWISNFQHQRRNLEWRRWQVFIDRVESKDNQVFCSSEKKKINWNQLPKAVSWMPILCLLLRCKLAKNQVLNQLLIDVWLSRTENRFLS